MRSIAQSTLSRGFRPSSSFHEYKKDQWPWKSTDLQADSQRQYAILKVTLMVMVELHPLTRRETGHRIQPTRGGG